MNIQSILKIVQGWVKLKGDTDGTFVGNVGDRLKVNIPGGSIPSERVVPAAVKLKNAGSSAMNVDGSSTSVAFTAGPTTTNEIWYLTRIAVALDDSGNSGRADFGAISGGITNGLLTQMILNSTTYSVSLIKNNGELIQGFENTFRGQSTSFINDANFVSAITKLSIPVILKESTSDQVKITVQDNLTGLGFLETTLFYFRVVG